MTSKGVQCKKLFLEVIDKNRGIVIAGGASDVSENYFSIFACSNVEAGKSYKLEFLVNYKDIVNGLETEVWKKKTKNMQWKITNKTGLV